MRFPAQCKVLNQHKTAFRIRIISSFSCFSFTIPYCVAAPCGSEIPPLSAFTLRFHWLAISVQTNFGPLRSLNLRPHDFETILHRLSRRMIPSLSHIVVPHIYTKQTSSFLLVTQFWKQNFGMLTIQGALSKNKVSVNLFFHPFYWLVIIADYEVKHPNSPEWPPPPKMCHPMEINLRAPPSPPFESQPTAVYPT